MAISGALWVAIGVDIDPRDYRTGGYKIAPLKPSGGVGGVRIAPNGGVRALSVAPSGGAMP